MKKLYIAFVCVLCLLVPAVIHAQVKDSVNSVLKGLEGDVKKITVQTDKGEVSFTGEQAEYLLNRMKKKEFAFDLPDEAIADIDFKGLDEKLRQFKMPRFNIIRHPDEDIAGINDYDKKITVEKKDGETKVTVKSFRDGGELIETYSGKDAEKYLKEMNNEEPVSLDFKSKDKDDNHKETKIIIIK
jgi:translation elongation factor EF-1beta